MAATSAKMESDETPDQYYTQDGRLASFQVAQPAARRGSNAKGKAPKAPSWPHKRLDPENVWDNAIDFVIRACY